MTEIKLATTIRNLDTAIAQLDVECADLSRKLRTKQSQYRQLIKQRDELEAAA